MNGQRTNRLTVGELFPARDIVAEWVFSVTALIEDIQVVVGPSKEAMEARGLCRRCAWCFHVWRRPVGFDPADRDRTDPSKA